jgi:aldehyde dehydrogenase (NAD+)
MRAYDYDTFYIGGTWVEPAGDATADVVNPATEQVIGRIPMGDARDADRAVRAARDAFPAWAQTPVAERIAVVERIGEALRDRQEELALRIVQDLGMPRNLCQLTQVAVPAETFTLTAQEAKNLSFAEAAGQTQIWREPVGVVGAITPWNFPLAEIAAKVAPALVAGCPVVVKPSEVAPLAAYALAEVVHEMGLPPGVVNLVLGEGTVVGEAIAGHPGVDMVSFTGSTRAGRIVAGLAANNVTRVMLELGGKSANVMLPDANFGDSVPDGLLKAFLNSGQTCSALTRMIVPRDRLSEVEEMVVAAAEGCVMGDPMNEDTMLGPVVSAAQRDRVVAYIGRGIEEGARLVTGGPKPPDGLDRGYYVRPTVFSDVDSGMTIAQEEIFGPVLAILPYDNEADALRIADDTIYGLSAAVWSADRDRALQVARRLRVGQVEINEGTFDPVAPFGGFRQSGYGRSGGRYGIEEFCELKAVLAA